MPRIRSLAWVAPLVVVAGAVLRGGREVASGGDEPAPSTTAVAAPAGERGAPAPTTTEVTSPPGQPDPTTTVAPLGTDVAMVGDSLTEGVQDDMARLAPRFGFTLAIDGLQGRRIEGGLEPLDRLAPGRDLVVVALGTNDAQPGLTIDQARELIDQAMASVGDQTPVLWVNVFRTDSGAAAAAADRFDLALDMAVSRHPNLTVADWASHVRTRPDLRARDGIHLTTDGYLDRAEWLATAVADRLHLPAPPGAITVR
jgi:lysophospholipase L1-like esterase